MREYGRVVSECQMISRIEQEPKRNDERGTEQMALPGLSALSVRAPVPVGDTGDDTRIPSTRLLQPGNPNQELESRTLKPATSPSKRFKCAAFAVVAIVAVIVSAVAIVLSIPQSTTASAPETVQQFAVVSLKPSSRRRLSTVPPNQFEWQEGCQKSELVCQDVSNQWVDMSAFLEFSIVAGRGYKGAFAECAPDPQMTPFGISHAGGLFVEEYDNLRFQFRKGVVDYAAAVGVDFETANSGGNIIHKGGYATSCFDLNYFSDQNKYTCGLQALHVGLIYNGDVCKRLREDLNETIKAGSDMFLFEDDAPVPDEYNELTTGCLVDLGDLEVFGGLNQLVYNTTGTLGTGFVRIETSLALVPRNYNAQSGGVQGLVRQKERFELLSNVQLSGMCKLQVVLAIGAPSCNDPIVTVQEPLVDGTEYDNVDIASYQLGVHDYAYDAANRLWHHKTATECGKGCCDRCFQWYCPTHYQRFSDGTATWYPRRGGEQRSEERFECVPYTYTCSDDPSPDRVYQNSSDQVCGEPSRSTYDTVDRRRC